MKKKTGRNDPCPCGSGKKFKKCCESKMIGKKFMATQINTTSMVDKAKNLSSLFSKSCAPVQEPTNKEKSLADRPVTAKKDEAQKTGEKEEKEEVKNQTEEKLEEKNKNS